MTCFVSDKAAACRQNNGAAEFASGGAVLVQQPSVGTAARERGGILIYHERCHYHANDFSENTIITNNRNLNISPGHSARRGCIIGKLLSVYEN